MTIHAIDLNLLLVLHTVLAERNVARAAARLHVTPSAVSNALARLRDLFGDPLVTRQGRGVVPTPRATEIAPAVARAIRELDGIFASAPFDPATCARTFTLAVADVSQITWVPRLVEAMAVRMPVARLRVVGIDGLLSLGDLGASEVDVHVGLAAKGPGIFVESLFDETSVLVVRKSHPLAARKIARPAMGRLRHVRVQMLPNRSLRDPIALLFSRAGVPREVVVTVPSFTAAAEIVARSDLASMLPASFVAVKGEALGLVAVEAKLPPYVLPMSMCWHERTHADGAARAFRELVREVVGDGRLAGSTPPPLRPAPPRRGRRRTRGARAPVLPR